MRKFLVGWYNSKTKKVENEEIELASFEKANPKIFSEKIEYGLNHYNGYSCSEFDIQYWSLIEE